MASKEEETYKRMDAPGRVLWPERLRGGTHHGPGQSFGIVLPAYANNRGTTAIAVGGRRKQTPKEETRERETQHLDGKYV